MVRRILLSTVAALAVSMIAIPVAGAVTSAPAKIGPNQLFVGLVNGSDGVGTHAQIRVACPGPIRPGETTHPLAHQPLEVTPPAAVASNAGDTGAKGTHITAYMGIPPTASTPPTTGALPTFWRYGVAKPIPTSITVPCSGSGFVTFMPFPRDPGTSRAYVVPVDFVNVAV